MIVKTGKSAGMIALNGVKYLTLVKNCQLILKNPTRYMNTVNFVLNM